MNEVIPPFDLSKKLRKPLTGPEREALENWRAGFPVIAMRILREADYTPYQRGMFLRQVAGCETDVLDFAADSYLDSRTVLYVYATHRDDGFAFAVGEIPADAAKPNGGLAMFQRREDAHLFAYAIQAKSTAMVTILPSAQIDSTETA